MQRQGFCSLVSRIYLKNFSNLRSFAEHRSPMLQWYTYSICFFTYMAIFVWVFVLILSILFSFCFCVCLICFSLTILRRVLAYGFSLNDHLFGCWENGTKENEKICFRVNSEWKFKFSWTNSVFFLLQS